MQKTKTKNNKLFTKLSSDINFSFDDIKSLNKKSIIIIKSLYHNDVTSSIVYDFVDNLKPPQRKELCLIEVPGTFEIPFMIKIILEKIKNRKFTESISILAIGCVIKGETKHDEYIASTVINALRNLSLEYKIPIINGIITTLDMKQAKERAGTKYRKGKDFANSLNIIRDNINRVKRLK
tara:strand:- start:465 stop:1004 length:540 start_codon:yes stop_codon:yes gene_type:complete